MSTFGILVGGEPAPGINGVIGAAATAASRRGSRVIGIFEGFNHITRPLSIATTPATSAWAP